MIKDNSELKKFERDFIKNSNISLEKKYKILDSLYKEARTLGKFKSDNPLDGIELKIKIARVINSV